MIRDSMKSLTYYKRYLEFEFNRISKFEQAIKEVIAIRGEDEAVVSTYYSLQNFHFNVLVAMYSSDTSLDELKIYFPKVIHIMEKAWKKEDGYVEMLWMVSIGIMLDIPVEQMEKLKALIKRDHLDDPLINFLIGTQAAESPAQTTAFYYSQPYGFLDSVIKAADKDQAVERLKEYLSKRWYEGHKDTGWYESHKNREETYNGYWSFESGAIAKILELDDHSLKDTPYYPYDLVHYPTS